MTTGLVEVPRSDGRPLPLGFLLLLAALGAMGPLSIDMYLPALPQIGRDLAGGSGDAQSSLAAYFAGLAIGQLVIGPLSDRWGRSRPLACGLLLYVLGSCGSMAAGSVAMLDAWRFLQALGGAAAMVIPRALIRDRQTGNAAARTASTLALVGGCAPVVAPLLGGLLLPLAGWRSIFAVLALLGTALFLAVRTRVADPPRGPAGPSPAGGGIAGSLAALLSDRAFLACAGAGTCASAAMFAYISGSPHVVITLYGIPPSLFGFFFLINVSAMIGASQLNRILLHRHPLRSILACAGWACPLAGSLLVAVAWSGLGGLWGISACVFLIMACIGMVGINAAILALEAHGSRAGLAAAVMGSLQFAVSAAASWLTGALHDGSAMPMAWVIAGMLAGSGTCCLLATRKRIADRQRASGAGLGDRQPAPAQPAGDPA